jgi:hypothetical protein
MTEPRPPPQLSMVLTVAAQGAFTRVSPMLSGAPLTGGFHGLHFIRSFTS